MARMKTALKSLRCLGSFLAIGSVLLGGCASGFPLMPTPTVYTGPAAKPLFTAPANAPKSSAIELLYITDRAPRRAGDATESADSEDALPYTAERSPSMAFGTVTVEFGENVAWGTLAAQSVAPERTVELDLELRTTIELGRFPRLRYAYKRLPDGSVQRDPATLAQHHTAAEGLQAALAQRLAAAPRKELVLFVHGYANSFRDAALTMGELCHFLGREFACAIFSWPAGGSRGVFFGYNVDRESSEYAVLHLKQALRIAAATPGLERLHLLAHSRGTDVLLSAVQQLAIEHYAGRVELADRLKLRNVVLIAPDIDMEVAATKIFALSSDPDMLRGGRPDPTGRLTTGAMHATIYASPEDSALSFAEYLFGSLYRLGRLNRSMFDEQALARLSDLRGIDIIDVFGSTDLFGHSYFVSNPAASADLVGMIRYDLKLGDPGRPAEEIRKPFWRIGGAKR
jgi:esterase/lipase superfamily enzyme